MSLSIRQARPGDGALVLALVRELAVYERLEDEVDATQEMLAAALFGPDRRVFCDIGECEGQPVGFALWFYSFSTFRGRHGIYLEDIFVRPAARGRGLGKALLRGLARRCRDENLARLEWSVLDWNEPALAFYRSLGATAMEEWTIQRLTGDGLARLADQP
jgi:GNAT superfamily N-acetyltransferase